MANAWGFHDMLGNAEEWVNDRFAPLEAGKVVDPTGPKEGRLRVLRGGSWNVSARSVRLGARSSGGQQIHFPQIGFRLARTIPAD
jgi:formylglycine-generating enzyme required for sulfatase activity